MNKHNSDTSQGYTSVTDSECVPAIRHWYESGAGKHTAMAIRLAVAEMSSDVFGYYAVQVGELAGRYDLLEDSRIRSRFAIATEEGNGDEVDLVADPAHLPLAFDNLDLVVACHVLDCAATPHQIIREIERILVPEGHCILIAFNPFSSRGFKLIIKRLLKQKNGQVLYTTFRLRDWFEVLGFEVQEVRSVGQHFRIENLPVIRRFSWLQRWVNGYYQLFGQVQLIYVQKKVSRLTPWRPQLGKRPLLKPGMAVNSSGAGKTVNKVVPGGKNEEN